jgi:ElaB/YqjD/DUF883 family membrane-anchored ribosome-binding protein
MNKWTAWYDSLPEHTKQYLKTQPIWHDRDLAKAAAVGAVVGFLIGLLY